jgi:hypothetical protein
MLFTIRKNALRDVFLLNDPNERYSTKTANSLQLNGGEIVVEFFKVCLMAIDANHLHVLITSLSILLSGFGGAGSQPATTNLAAKNPSIPGRLCQSRLA